MSLGDDAYSPRKVDRKESRRGWGGSRGSILLTNVGMILETEE